MKSIVRLLGVAVLCASLFHSGESTAQTPSPTKIRVASVVSSAWLPLWVAKDKGIFASHGLDVDITTVQNVSTVVGALGRQFEVSGCTPIDIIKARLRKLDIVGISGNTQEMSANQQMRLLARTDGSIRSLADLKGQVVATPSLNGVIHIATLHALRQQGVEAKDVRFQEMAFANMADQLAAGRVAAAEIVEPFASAPMKVEVTSLGNPMLSVADPVILTCWMASGAWARDNRPAVLAWRAALDEAMQYIQKNDKEARAVLSKWTRLPDEVAGSVRLPAYTTRLDDAEIATWTAASFAAGAIGEKANAAGSSFK